MIMMVMNILKVHTLIGSDESTDCLVDFMLRQKAKSLQNTHKKHIGEVIWIS